ncbi:MAG: hypothetical protein ACRD16_09265 [Thermoanaerobaculia bacterium]
MRKPRRFPLFVVALLLAPVLRAGEPRVHEHEVLGPENYGSVQFAVSCSPAAREQFTRAVAILHSFGYELAERSFREVARTDSKCAMAFWGVAMSRYHPLWYPPSPDDLRIGRESVARARALGAPTRRERSYIEAMGSFYDDSERVSHETRAARYEEAMRRISVQDPRDREGAAFYALALLSTASPTDKAHVKQKKAAAILEEIFSENPKHPGAAHYMIHAFDSPELAPLALDAARSYAKIAPAAPHALHMPSHIFTRLGDWDDSISSNRASAAAARTMAGGLPPGVRHSQELHALDYLVYADLQEGREREARAILGETLGIAGIEPKELTGAFALSAIPARCALERERFEEASNLELAPAALAWNDFPYAEGIVVFARTVGLARLGRVEKARAELSRLDPILERASVLSRHGYDWATQVQILRREALAWIEEAAGKGGHAVELMKAAADLEDSTEKHPVTPGAIVPAREFLGELLLEEHMPAKALAEYERSLESAPNRLHGLRGALKAARLAGDQGRVRKYAASLAELLSHADAGIPELEDLKPAAPE